MLTELSRSEGLSRIDVMDTLPEQSFDRLTSIAAKLFDVPVVLLSFLGDNSRWVKSAQGYAIEDVPRELTFCDHFLGRDDSLVVRDTLEHPELSTHPFVVGAPYLRFYAGVALSTPEGAAIGTLCLYDFAPRPAFLDDSLAVLRDLALVAMDLLEQRQHAARSKRLFRRAVLMEQINGLMVAAPDMVSAVRRAASTLADEHNPLSVRILVRSSIETAFQQLVFSDVSGELDRLSRQDISRELGALAQAGLDSEGVFAAEVDAQALRIAAHRDPGAGRSRVFALGLPTVDDQYVILLEFDPRRGQSAELAGDLQAAIASLRPVLAHKANEEQLRLFKQALDMAADGISIVEGEAEQPSFRRFIYVNQALCRLTGYAPEELIGRSPTLLHGPETEPKKTAAISEGRKPDNAKLLDVLDYRKDGTSFIAQTTSAPISGGTAGPRRFVTVKRDVTKSRELRAKDRQIAESFRLLFAGNPLPMWVFDRVTRCFLMVNDAAVAFYGWSREQFLSMSLDDIRPPAELPAMIDGLMREDRSMSDGRIWVHRRADGSIVRMGGVTKAHPLHGENSVVGVLWDMTEVYSAREELKRNNDILSDLAEQLRRRTEELLDAHRLAQLGTWRLAPDLSTMLWSPEVANLLGRSPRHYPASYDNLMDAIHPEDRPVFDQARSGAMASGDGCNVEVRIVRPDASERRARFEFKPRSGDDAGEWHFGLVQDVTDRWATQQALMRSERLAILGHLTGGIAHDFNNLLTVVTLNLEEVIAELPDGDDLQAVAVPALQAAQRAADLTSQLLAYARQAPLRPQPVNLNSFLRLATPLLRRTVGQRHTVIVRGADMDITPLVDPSQLQTAILHVAMNARDAMADGGEVVIRVRPVSLPSPDCPLDRPLLGRYAEIAVSDSGCGIVPELLPRVFEPFLTTKKGGSGSGLGLSMVQGFIDQSRGYIAIESEVGLGTTVKLFLPLAEQERPTVEARSDDSGKSRVLIVEDQPAVLATVTRMFKQLGYEVRGVDCAAAALDELDRGGDFDLLFSDIVLPGDIDGIALSKVIVARVPSMRVLLTSGYSEYNVMHTDQIGSEILMKPYKRQDLLDRLTRLMPSAAAR